MDAPALFQRYPELVARLPHRQLADLPTPVEPLDRLGSEASLTELWVKRDDVSARPYGGNKPRKLELLLADALARGSKRVIAVGADGSNHGVAVCLFGRRLGLEVTVVTVPQPPLPGVRKNILVAHAAGARMVHAPNDAALVPLVAWHAMRAAAETRRPPYIMYFGGSSPLGAVGFVSAAFELADQVRAGLLPCPRYVFLPVGSCGSQAGLEVGLRAAGLDTRVIGVRVAPRIIASRYHVAAIANLTAQLLHSRSEAFPEIRIRPADVTVLEDHFGAAYGEPTDEGAEAIELAARTEGLALEPTYTGKTLAGMLAWLRKSRQRGEPALFWLTHSSQDLSRYLERAPDPATLAAGYRRYFRT